MTSLLDCIYADYRANFKQAPSLSRVLVGYFLKAGFRAALLYRIGRRSRLRGGRLIGPLMDRLIFRKCNIDICTLAEIGPGLAIPHAVGIVIGAKCRIGRNCHLLQGVTLGGAGGKTSADGRTQPLVGDDVVLGAGAKLIGPVKVGDRAVIGANSVVVSDIPDDAVAAGIPARVLRIKQVESSGV